MTMVFYFPLPSNSASIHKVKNDGINWVVIQFICIPTSYHIVKLLFDNLHEAIYHRL